MRVCIQNRGVGDGEPPFIIAEAGVNHNGRNELALDLVDIASKAGADAVKFQTFRTEELLIPSTEKAGYQKEATGSAETQYQMLKNLELPLEEFRDIAEYAESRGLIFLSTPTDTASVDLLNRLGVPAIKVASGDLGNEGLLTHIAGTGKPVILSTGMATLGEIEEALGWLRQGGACEVILLQCTSLYPTRADQVNLRAMETLRGAFQVPVGLSDHTTGISVPCAAAALGASVIEKHFTADKSLPGPDHRISLDPKELAAMVAAVHEVHAALGDGRKHPLAEELPNRKLVRRSLVAAEDISQGTILTGDQVAVKRPGTGIPPKFLGKVVGMRSKRRIPRDTILRWDFLEPR